MSGLRSETRYHVQKEIVSDVLRGSATDFSGASVESDEPPTKKIRERAPKENTAQFNFRNCSVVFNISKYLDEKLI